MWAFLNMMTRSLCGSTWGMRCLISRATGFPLSRSFRKEDTWSAVVCRYVSMCVQCTVYNVHTKEPHAWTMEMCSGLSSVFNGGSICKSIVTRKIYKKRTWLLRHTELKMEVSIFTYNYIKLYNIDRDIQCRRIFGRILYKRLDIRTQRISGSSLTLSSLSSQKFGCVYCLRSSLRLSWASRLSILTTSGISGSTSTPAHMPYTQPGLSNCIFSNNTRIFPIKDN